MCKGKKERSCPGLNRRGEMGLSKVKAADVQATINEVRKMANFDLLNYVLLLLSSSH